MALIIYPDGKQEHTTLPGTSGERIALLSAKLGEPVDTAGTHIAAGSVAAHLKYVQIGIMYYGHGQSKNVLASKFAGHAGPLYNGPMVFLRKEERISG